MGDGARVGMVLAAVFAAAAVNSAYLPLWFSDHGLTAAEIGLVLGAASLMRVVAGPGGGWLADLVGRRAVLVASAFMAGCAAGVLPALDGVGPVLVAVVVLGVAGSLLSPVLDAVTLALAGERRLDYGQTRAWGSVAYMVATAVSGWLLARAGTGVVPWTIAAAFFTGALLMLRLPDAARASRQSGSLDGPFRNPAFRATLMATALIQGSHAAYYSFAPLLWRHAGISDTVIGLLIAEGIVAEVALFVWGRAWVERLGPARLTGLAASACLVRWTATAFTTEVALLAAIQLLHSVTFACQHLSSMAVLRAMPPGRAGMAQTVLAALGFSLPTGVLVWATGQVFGTLGALAFLPMAVVGGAALLLVGALPRAAPAAGSDGGRRLTRPSPVGRRPG